MRLFFVLFFIAVLVNGCKKGKTLQCPYTAYSYTYKTNARVDTVRSSANWLVAVPASGNKLVFAYEMNYTTCPEIADGGLTQLLFFEVSPSVSSFNYTASDFENAKVYFRRICFCGEVGAIIPDSGTIKGNRLNANSWQIDFEILINNERVKNSAVFTLK